MRCVRHVVRCSATRARALTLSSPPCSAPNVGAPSRRAHVRDQWPPGQCLQPPAEPGRRRHRVPGEGPAQRRRGERMRGRKRACAIILTPVLLCLCRRLDNKARVWWWRRWQGMGQQTKVDRSERGTCWCQLIALTCGACQRRTWHSTFWGRRARRCDLDSCVRAARCATSSLPAAGP